MNESHFHRLIGEQPHDAATRLAFADWLEERGRDAESAAVRKQVADAGQHVHMRHSSDVPCHYYYIAPPGTRLHLPEMPMRNVTLFPCRLRRSWPDFLNEMGPLETLGISMFFNGTNFSRAPADHLAALNKTLAHPTLRELKELRLDLHEPEPLKTFLQSGNAEKLEVLYLDLLDFTSPPDELTQLLITASLPKLKKLSVHFFDEKTIKALTAADNMKKVELFHTGGDMGIALKRRNWQVVALREEARHTALSGIKPHADQPQEEPGPERRINGIASPQRR